MPTLKLTEKSLSQPWLPAGKAQIVVRDEELPGFVVTIGKVKKTFAVDYRAGGKRRLLTIGHHGVLMPDGREPWNVLRARLRARELLGQVAAGGDPGAAPEPAPAPKKGPTLREGLDLHIESLNARKKSARSIETIRDDCTRHLGTPMKWEDREVIWLDAPLETLTPLAVRCIHREIKKRAVARAKTRAKESGRTARASANPPGTVLANRVVRHIKTLWNRLDGYYELQGRNPAKRFDLDVETPRETRVNDDDFVDWYRRVNAMENPIRRDLQQLALFTGARRGSVCRVRWPDVDFEHLILTFQFAKGGRPYSVPMGPRIVEILRRREAENPTLKEFIPFGGDHGYVFPSFSNRKPIKVIAVAEPKEYRQLPTEPDAPEDAPAVKVRELPPIHDLRRTYNSVALEVGVPLEQRNMLVNHARQGVNVKHYSVPQVWGFLMECQVRIDEALHARLTGSRT